MKLVSLYASNFKKLKFDEPLKFNDGVAVISGLNESGKSTILDAILYSLYGKVIRPSLHAKDTDIIGYGANSAKITLEFEIPGKLYRVRREIYRNKPNTAILDEVLTDRRLKPMATKVKEVNDEVEKLLGGITFNEIVSSNIVAQKDLDRLLKEGADRKKDIIEAFLNLDSFTTVRDKLKEERKNLEGTGPSRPGEINLEKNKLEKLRSEFEEFNHRKLEINQFEGTIEKLRKELGELETNHKELEVLHEKLTSYDRALTLRNQIETEVKGKKELLKNHEGHLDSLSHRIQELKAQLNKHEDLPPDETMTDIQDILQELKDLDQRKIDGEVREKKIAEEVRQIEEQLKGFDIEELEKARGANKSRKPYAVGGIVIALFILLGLLIHPFLLYVAVVLVLVFLLVGREMNMRQISKLVMVEGLLGKKELLDGKREELSDIKNEILGISKRSESEMKSFSQTLRGVTRYETIVKEEGKNPILAAELMLSQFGKDKAEKARINSGIQSFSESLGEATKKVDISKVRSEIAVREEQVAKVGIPQLPNGMEFSKELLRDISNRKESRKGDIGGCRAKIKNSEERIEENIRYVEQHKDIELKVESQEKHVHDLEHKVRVIREAINGIDKTSELLAIRVRPNVESYMGQILPSITSGRYKAVMMDETFGLKVWDPEAGEFRPKEVFSGGTEDQFLLAMRLAFALALMPEVKGTKPDFLFLDEPLGSSDEVRRSGIIDYLNIGLSKIFSQILIISHVGGLEELVPNVIKLDDGRVVSQ